MAFEKPSDLGIGIRKTPSTFRIVYFLRNFIFQARVVVGNFRIKRAIAPCRCQVCRACVAHSSSHYFSSFCVWYKRTTVGRRPCVCGILRDVGRENYRQNARGQSVRRITHSKNHADNNCAFVIDIPVRTRIRSIHDIREVPTYVRMSLCLAGLQYGCVFVRLRIIYE